MIYSLTIAPCIDYYLNLGEKDLKVGRTNRPQSEGYAVGGKGINVSLMLKNIKVDSIPLIAVGGKTGNQIKDLIEPKFDKIIYLATKSDSRTNVMITGPKQDTRFNTEAPKLKDAALDKMFNYFKKHLKKDDIVILSGSVGQEDGQIYEKIMRECTNPAKAKVILDTTGDSLTGALKQHPFMIKPNEGELSDIIGEPMDSEENILMGGEKLKAMGPTTVLVTLGKNGAYYFAEDGHIYRCYNAVGTQISAVGAGDSSIAGFIKGLNDKVSIERRLQYSMAAGGATAFSKRLGSNKLFKSLINTIKVTLVK